MADLTPLKYDPSQHEDMCDGFKVVPPGIYTVVIVKSDVQDTKAGTGKILELTYQIVDGQQVGSTLTDRINIINPSDVAQKIGLSQLKNICDAVGHVGQLKNSEQLHGKQFSVQVTIEKFMSNGVPPKELESNKIGKRMANGAAVSSQKQAAEADDKPKAAIGW
jgi:hypothetical protein